MPDWSDCCCVATRVGGYAQALKQTRGYDLNKQMLLLALAAIGSGAGFTAHATTTWTFNVPAPTGSPCTVTGSGAGNFVQCNPNGGGAPKVVATAWANTSGVGSGTTNTSGAGLQTATVAGFGSSGLGVRNQAAADLNEGTSPEHAIDNNFRNSSTTTILSTAAVYDSILLSFDTAVAMTGITIGWGPGDADLTVSAYLGVGAPTLAGRTYGNLTAAGWTYVEHEANMVSGTQRLINGATGTANGVSAATVTSRYWMISAYNPTRGGDTSISGLNVGNDYFKLLSVAAATSSPPAPGGVPEPAALSLIGVAALGATAASRRRKAVAA